MEDPSGRIDTDSISISADNSPPNIPTISTPADESLYRDGQSVALAGSATDPQQGALPASALTWTVTLQHASHSHPLLNDTGTASTSFEPSTDHDADSFYDITLTARDAQGLTSSRTIQVRPETVALALQSSPAGAPLSYAGSGQTAPFSTQAAIGFETTVSAAQEFTQGARTYVFDSWSNGGSRLQDITIPASALTLTATYRDVTPGSVTVVKQTEPAASNEQFAFSGDLGPFSLTGASGGNTRSFPVAAGTYDVTETGATGWDLTLAACTDGSAVSGATASIGVSPGESVTCTFRNTKQGQITVQALTRPAEEPPLALFSFSGASPLESFELGHAQTRVAQAPPGTYLVQQAGREDYLLTAVRCDDADSTASTETREALVRLGPGEAVLCTFTSEPRPVEPPPRRADHLPHAPGPGLEVADGRRDRPRRRGEGGGRAGPRHPQAGQVPLVVQADRGPRGAAAILRPSPLDARGGHGKELAARARRRAADEPVPPAGARHRRAGRLESG